MTTQYLITIALSIMFSLFSSKIDSEHLLKKEYIKDHTSRFMQRFIATCPYFLVSWRMALISGLVFWVMFDASLNIRIGFKLFYTGTVSDTDKAFQNKKWLYIASKIASIIIITLIIIL